MSTEPSIQEQHSDEGNGEFATNALNIVGQELMETIRNAHLALEEIRTRSDFPGRENFRVVATPAHTPVMYCALREPVGHLVEEGLPFMFGDPQ